MLITRGGVAVTELVDMVKGAITASGISRIEQTRDMRVVAAGLSLNAVATRTAGGRIEFRIPVLGVPLALGRKATAVDTHSIEINLVPVEDDVEARGTPIEETLAEAIETVRAAVRRASTGDDPFKLGRSTIELRFAITSNGTITMGFDGEFADEVTQSLRLELDPA